jgi:hypothetical protein
VQTDWNNMIYPSTVMLAMLTDNQAFHTAAQAYLQKWLCRCESPPLLFSMLCMEGLLASNHRTSLTHAEH